MNNPILQMLSGGSNISPQLLQLLQLMQNGGNKRAIMGMLTQQYPELKPLIDGDQLTPQSMEQFCRAVCQQRGIDFNQVHQQAQQLIKQFNIK